MTYHLRLIKWIEAFYARVFAAAHRRIDGRPVARNPTYVEQIVAAEFVPWIPQAAPGLDACPVPP